MNKDLDQARAARLREKHAQAASDAALDLPVLQGMSERAKALAAGFDALVDESRTVIADQTPRGPLAKYAETVRTVVSAFGTTLDGMAATARQTAEKAAD